MDVQSIIIAAVIAPFMWIIIEWILNHTILVGDPTTSRIIAAIVVVVILAGVVFWSAFTHKPQADIRSHKDRNVIPHAITIGGEYTDFSEDDALWVYVQPSVSELYYFRKAILLNHGEWETLNLLVGEVTADKQPYELGLLLANKQLSIPVDGMAELPEGVKRLGVKIAVYRETVGATVIPEPTIAAQVTNSPVPMPTSTLVPLPTVTSVPTRPTTVPTSTTAPSPTHTATAKLPTITPTPALGIGSTDTRTKDGAVMMYVPAGEFMMGSDLYDDEQPIHAVYLDEYWIDKTEVTNGMYTVCVEDDTCTQPSILSSSTYDNYYLRSYYVDYPVMYVSWYDAVAYCEWAGGRLPTEAEWEKASRWDEENQNARTYPWGGSINCDHTNYTHSCVSDTTAVGSYPDGSSPYGALDMTGNVWEWISDIYDADYYEQLVYGNPVGASEGNEMVIRGGAWSSDGFIVRAANRYSSDPINSNGSLGFRCVQE